MRSPRIGWLGHIIKLEDQRLTKKLYKWKPIGNRTVSRLKMRWEDDINDLKKMKVTRDKRASRRIEKAKKLKFEVIVS